jgi:hypothetical protein
VTSHGDQSVTMRGTAVARGARWWVFGSAAVYFGTAAGLFFAVPTDRIRLAMEIVVAVGLAAYLPLQRLIHHRPIALTVESGLLTLGRFGAARGDRPVAMGDWFDRWTGVSRGSVAHVSTDKGRVVRVGGAGHRTPVAAHTARPSRSVEITLTGEDFARLFTASGDTVTKATGAGVQVELFNRVNRGRSGCLRLLLPLLVLYVAAGVTGGGLFLLNRYGHPSPEAQVVAGFVGSALILIGLVATIVITQRRRPTPVLRLDFHDGILTVRSRRGRVTAQGRPRWRRMRYPYRDLSGQDVSCPVIELAVPPHAPFTVGLLEPGHRWRRSVPTTGMPRYLVGEPDWPALLAALGGPEP